MLSDGADMKTVRQKREELRQQAKTIGAIAGATRASDLQSPAPRGHLLRIFGQSDRETIENASREAAVPQALAMLNGPVAAALASPGSHFFKDVEAGQTTAAELDTIYLGLLSRYPTNNERQTLAQVAAERGVKAREDIIHALMNSGEFLFVK